VKKKNSRVIVVLATSALLVALGQVRVQGDETGAISTIRVSVDSDGNQVAGGNSASPSISDDGRYVVFQSNAVDLVDDDTNGLQDIFVHDRDADADGIFDETGAVSTIRVSVDSDGNQVAGGSSASPSISDDGRYVVFQSNAVDLVDGKDKISLAEAKLFLT